MRNLTEKYFPIVENYHNSGLSVQAFSDQQGISLWKLHYWKKKYRDHQTASADAKGFAPLLVETPRNFASIQYPEGTRLVFEKAIEASVLKQFLPAFSRNSADGK